MFLKLNDNYQSHYKMADIAIKQENTNQKNLTQFSYCPCDGCQKVNKNMIHDHWIHKGFGNYTEEQFAQLKLGIYEKAFMQPEGTKFSKYKPNKPSKAIWFSCGSWLFDPFCEAHYNVIPEKNFLRKPHEHVPKIQRVITIDCPKNVLSIDSYEAFLQFVKKYSKTRLSKQSQIIKKEIANLVEDDNYFGYLRTEKDVLVANCEKICLDRGISYNKLIEISQYVLGSKIPDYEDKTKQVARYLRENKPTISDSFSIIRNIGFIFKRESYEKLMTFKEKTIKDPTKCGIDWDSVARDHWGVAFKFRKLHHLNDYPESSDVRSQMAKKIRATNIEDWFSGFDVESLCIFDIRAFDNKVVIEEVCL